MGYLISAAEGQTSVNLTDSQWRALIYVASQHGFSAPYLRLEGEDQTLEVAGSNALGLRSALGKALEACEALSKVETLQRELGRLEGRLELTEVAQSTLRDHLERERKRADEGRERANHLEEELREARRPWWRRWFDA